MARTPRQEPAAMSRVDRGDDKRVDAGRHDVAAETQLRETAQGRVNSYSVAEDRLMIKLDVSASFRLLVQVGSDKPHFRSAVSMAMMAFHTPDTRLTVRYLESGNGGVVNGLEVGIGKDPDKALSFADWPLSVTR